MSPELLGWRSQICVAACPRCVVHDFPLVNVLVGNMTVTFLAEARL